MNEPHSEKPNAGDGTGTPEPPSSPWATPSNESPESDQQWPASAAVETQDAPAEQKPREPDAQVMARLPRSRPQRRSARRAPSRRVTRKATPAARKGTAKSRSGSNSAKTSRAAKGRATTQSTPGIPERAIGIAFAPIKLTANLTRGTAKLIGRNIRLP